ncbi:hypothetical protein EJ074_09250 [Mesorhizobium sp. M3A.F.Ca.ET.080.04.2.1]|uniref:hypothetical protein n=1 Tax=Mesorhizobium sp. M3A.F.Ca.ET.080.04.2.1 TaxID=2493676 RepID=UPI000F75E65A|nr:hypothetical protein [Mesorhizobium sp. M3A.F.Ca.ET.080.04.2.1]AZO09283.1 hypothetical protein EJ074_09250 [Mesorhizobium sp. M3A.F.Ca.ET.080.04.2.1]RWF14803.1 MAG: hypothetical protein EOS64_27845 [Mesorhizobium sp.]
MKILSFLKTLSVPGPRRGRRDESEIAGWVVDPLSHPVLDTMSERELGDMPFRLTAGRTAYETACR